MNIILVDHDAMFSKLKGSLEPEPDEAWKGQNVSVEESRVFYGTVASLPHPLRKVFFNISTKNGNYVAFFGIDAANKRTFRNLSLKLDFGGEFIWQPSNLHGDGYVDILHSPEGEKFRRVLTNFASITPGSSGRGGGGLRRKLIFIGDRGCTPRRFNGQEEFRESLIKLEGITQEYINRIYSAANIDVTLPEGKYSRDIILSA